MDKLDLQILYLKLVYLYAQSLRIFMEILQQENAQLRVIQVILLRTIVPRDVSQFAHLTLTIMPILSTSHALEYALQAYMLRILQLEFVLRLVNLG